jgi:hypothetical protein
VRRRNRKTVLRDWLPGRVRAPAACVGAPVSAQRSFDTPSPGASKRAGTVLAGILTGLAPESGTEENFAAERLGSLGDNHGNGMGDVLGLEHALGVFAVMW